MSLSIPSRQQAEQYLCEAEQRNPGGWVAHSRYAAQAAEAIARAHPDLDSDNAYILALLHDIGRREGITDLRHTLDGWRFLHAEGYEDAARGCITHSFPIKDVSSGAGVWDCTPDELDFMRRFLSGIVYHDYDRLLQLCDALALPTGFCLIEKRLIDVALRRGINDLTVARWRVFLQHQHDFEQAIGGSIYRLLPGVVENTFGY